MQPLPIAIVGLNFGRNIIDRLAAPEAACFFKVQAVCDLDAAKSEDFGRRLNVPHYTDLNALLACPDIPVIGLFTGPAGRAALLRTILRAGKDVMTTKPFELDPAAARSVLEEARESRRIIHLNSPGPLPSPAVRKIKEWERVHNLGRPVHCVGEATASYREKADGTWYDDPVRCPVAPIFRIGIYTINDFIQLFGPVKDIHIQTARLFTGRPTPDSAQIGLLFENGMLGCMHASFCVDNGQHYANSFRIHYERGTILHNMGLYPFDHADKSANLELGTLSANREVLIEKWSAPENTGAYQWEMFFEAIRQRDVASTPVADILASVNFIAALSKAARQEEGGRMQGPIATARPWLVVSGASQFCVSG